jgi:hypothetical protein
MNLVFSVTNSTSLVYRHLETTFKPSKIARRPRRRKLGLRHRTLRDLRIFHNLAKSEQTHMDAVEALVDRYGVEDPAAGIVS